MKNVLKFLTAIFISVLLLTACQKEKDVIIPSNQQGTEDTHQYLKRSTGGDLLWYKHNGWQTGSVSWQGALTVGTGWSGFKSVFSTSNGVVYGIQPDGKLLWYKHTGLFNGTNTWANSGAGIVVGSGWQNFKAVFATSNGVIYAIKADGSLLWYYHQGWQNGTVSWVGPVTVGSGWQNFKSVFATSNGVIYGIQTNGSLLWYKHHGWQNGTVNSWSGAVTVGSGWQNFKSVFATSNGVIYGIQTNGSLLWYNHHGWQDGTVNSWSGAVMVGSGWQNFKSAFATNDGFIYGINP